LPKQLGNVIQRARKQRGLTQTELTQISGLRQEMISRIEIGHQGTKLSSLYAVFAALDLDLLVDIRSGEATKEVEEIF
jgi:HTH-type transcriptional regulator/antitoxin HipB